MHILYTSPAACLPVTPTINSLLDVYSYSSYDFSYRLVILCNQYLLSLVAVIAAVVLGYSVATVYTISERQEVKNYICQIVSS
jgi:hypothetical protein